MIDKYQLSDDCFIPDGFEKERMNEIAVFDATSFMEAFKGDFEAVELTERFFFTDSMVDEYIQWAVEYCKKELEALKGGTVYFNEYEWSWGRA